MDLTASIAPKSDQLNADDLITGPRTFTLSDVRPGSAEQPFDFHLVELPDRPYRPSKSMRRVLVAAWGAEASAYSGRRVTLYRDPEVMFGRDKVGGIKISHLSHIDRPLTLALTATRGKRVAFTVEPLTEAAPVTLAPRDHLAAHMRRNKLDGAWLAEQMGVQDVKWGDVTDDDAAGIMAGIEGQA